MNRFTKSVALVLSGVILLQFGGCLAANLANVFFAIGPLLL